MNRIPTHNLCDTSAVLYQLSYQAIGFKYIIFHIFICIALPSTLLLSHITNSQCDQLPEGLIAQLVEHCIGIAEGMASNPVKALISQLL